MAMGQMESEKKVRENRLRRMAERQALILVKSRTRDKNAVGYGWYLLYDNPSADTAVFGSPDMDGIETYLNRNAHPDWDGPKTLVINGKPIKECTTREVHEWLAARKQEAGSRKDRAADAPPQGVRLTTRRQPTRRLDMGDGTRGSRYRRNLRL